MTISTVNPQICITILSNNKFEWIELYEGITEDELQDEINGVCERLNDGEDYEWIISDTEGMAGYSDDDLETLCKVANAIHEHGEGAIEGFLNCQDADELDNFSDYYYGCHASEEDFTEELFTDCNEIPSHLEYYIDWEKMARDWFISDFYSHQESYNEVHVYRR